MSASPPITRDTEVWYHDGNVVLVAEDVAFRVHRSILEASKSAVFRTLFEVPQPLPAAADHLDGCPVVHVSDCAYDMREFLAVLYSGPRAFAPSATYTLPKLLAVARLSHKYELEDVLAAATARLAAGEFPLSFATWDAHQSAAGSDADAVRLAQAIPAVNLFRRIGRHDLLPAAYYHCYRLPARALLEGRRCPESGVLERFTSAEALAECIAIRDTFFQNQGWMFRGFAEIEMEGGGGHQEDCERLWGDFHDAQRNFSSACWSVDSGFGLLASRREEFAPFERCEQCYSRLTERWDALRQDMWTWLPVICGLPHIEGWDTTSDDGDLSE
ncbi:uncharacterized protein BXZ73DRAFT_44668 [Epithele typhae]|uniref:uncharacterized protein n=1 Tax=Epithele typhae TaxID=378194 RepID=UPI0020074AB5|nr:uncharacterized protein BXZ73DRAFT_44668 [Epithele typhae]KAH9937913.1 hypothetical protein BXZ73DRAFT_44668 [Epithele typhae]